MNELIKNYYELLTLWNRKMNLTAIGGVDDFERKHVADSMALIVHLGGAKTLLDLGTGAGIPGIIIKIARPDIEVVLLDSTRKKISFCDEAIRKLRLTGIRAVQGRAEDGEIKESLGRFDAVVSRAAWKLSEFIAIASEYLAETGVCIAMKGPRWKEELTAASDALSDAALGLKNEEHYTLQGGEERCLLIFKHLA